MDIPNPRTLISGIFWLVWRFLRYSVTIILRFRIAYSIKFMPSTSGVMNSAIRALRVGSWGWPCAESESRVCGKIFLRNNSMHWLLPLLMQMLSRFLFFESRQPVYLCRGMYSVTSSSSDA